MKKQTFYKLVSLAFLFLIVLFLVLFLVVRDKAWSDAEHRELMQLSDVRWTDWLTGEMEEDAHEYVTDQLPGRSFLRAIRTTCATVGGERQNADVYRGKSDYLIERFREPDSALFNRQVEAINAFAAKNKRLNQYMMLVPSASAIMKLKLPQGALLGDEESYLASWQEKLGEEITYIDVSKTLRNHRDEYIYYRTDPEWTSLGAYYAFRESASPLGLDLATDRYESLPVTDDYRGTLPAKSGYNRNVRDTIYLYFNQDDTFLTVMETEEGSEKSATIYPQEALETEDKLDILFGGEHAVMQIETSSQSERILLVFKDSRTDAFLPFLLSNFRTVVVVDLDLYEGSIQDILRKSQFTDILYLYQTSTLAVDTKVPEAFERAVSGDGAAK